MNRYGLKYHIIIDHTKNLLYRHNNGIGILDEEWDHLIILDACRYDMFEDAVRKGTLSLDGHLERRISRGSHTEEFLRENFDPSAKYDDIVYVSGNPHVEKIFPGCFHRTISVWVDGWSDEHHTVLPETMVERAIRAHRDFPDRRLIVHFMQPHFPFLPLGSVGDLGLERFREAVMAEQDEFENPTIWRLLEAGRVSIKQVRWGYRKNLDLVLPHAERLARILRGRIVITSDHGNALGERYHPLIPIRVYGHHYNVRIPALVEVPWYIYESAGEDQSEVEKAIISDRLGALLSEGKI